MMKFAASALLCLLACVMSHAQVLDVSNLNGSKVKYVSPEKLREYPRPALSYLNDDREFDKYKEEIVRKIIYPFLNKHERPVASLIVDFCPKIIMTGGDELKGCEGKDQLTVRVVVKEQSGLGFQVLLDIGADGKIDDKAHLVFFEEGYAKPPQ